MVCSTNSMAENFTSFLEGIHNSILDNCTPLYKAINWSAMERPTNSVIENL